MISRIKSQPFSVQSCQTHVNCSLKLNHLIGVGLLLHPRGLGTSLPRSCDAFYAAQHQCYFGTAHICSTVWKYLFPIALRGLLGRHMVYLPITNVHASHVLVICRNPLWLLLYDSCYHPPTAGTYGWCSSSSHALSASTTSTATSGPSIGYRWFMVVLKLW